MSHGLAIEFDGDGHVRPGDVLRGRIVVEKKRNSRGLAVRAAMWEQTKSEHVEILSTEPRQIHEGKLEAGARLPFALDVPADALPSFICKYGRIYWAVMVRSDELGLDTKTGWTFVVEAPPR